MATTRFQKMSQSEKNLLLSKVIDVLLYNDTALEDIKDVLDSYGKKSKLGTEEIVMKPLQENS